MPVRTFSISTSLAASTMTPGSTAPVVSRTTPAMALCADAGGAAAASTPKAIAAAAAIFFALMLLSPFVVAIDTTYKAEAAEHAEVLPQ